MAENPEQAAGNGKKLGTIFNNDINNILCSLDAGKTACEIAEDYRGLLRNLLAGKPRVLAQNVGLPDAVIYRSSAATTFDKHLEDVAIKTWRDRWAGDPEGGTEECARESDRLQADGMRRIMETGTDPFAITIEECRKHGALVVADYRMNAEDWYMHTYALSDFGRAHPEYRIRRTELEKRIDLEIGQPVLEFTGALDPAIPAVYDHYLAIFREVAERYDIDGIEFDWRRWNHMISDPHNNHPILTRMVRDTRKMLDEIARRKGRSHMLLGVRVGPLLDGEYRAEEFPGGTFYPDCWWAKQTPEFKAKEFPGAIFPSPDQSCRDLGLDVRTWVAGGLVDYVCPSLFWPRWPGLPRTREFAALAEGTEVGIYPTLFPLPDWVEEEMQRGLGPIRTEDLPRMHRYRKGFCDLAQRIYREGADGISTFNWYFHGQPYPYGCNAAIQREILSVMGDQQALAEYCKSSHPCS